MNYNKLRRRHTCRTAPDRSALVWVVGDNGLCCAPPLPPPPPLADISEIESYHSYSPQDDRPTHHSDLSSHSSNERLRDKTR